MQCVGPSMLPTFNSFGDIVLYEHFSAYTNTIEKGQPGYTVPQKGPARILSMHDAAASDPLVP